MADIDLAGLLKRFIADYGATKAERKKRYGKGETELSDIIKMFKPGGEFAKGTKTAALGAATKGFAGAGLGGVTPKAVSGPMASVIERMRTGGQAGALATRAQYRAQFPQLFPDPTAIANLATGGFSGTTSRIAAESLGGPLSDPYAALATPTSLLLSGGSTKGTTGFAGKTTGFKGRTTGF